MKFQESESNRHQSVDRAPEELLPPLQSIHGTRTLLPPIVEQWRDELSKRGMGQKSVQSYVRAVRDFIATLPHSTGSALEDTLRQHAVSTARRQIHLLEESGAGREATRFQSVIINGFLPALHAQLGLVEDPATLGSGRDRARARAHPEYQLPMMRTFDQHLDDRIAGRVPPKLGAATAINYRQVARKCISALYQSLDPTLRATLGSDPAKIEEAMRRLWEREEGRKVRLVLQQLMRGMSSTERHSFRSVVFNQFLPLLEGQGFPPLNLVSAREQEKASRRFEPIEAYRVWSDYVGELSETKGLRPSVARGYRRIVERFITFLTTGKVYALGTGAFPELAAPEAALVHQKVCTRPLENLSRYLEQFKKVASDSQFGHAEWILARRFYPLLARQNLVRFTWSQVVKHEDTPLIKEVADWEQQVLARVGAPSGSRPLSALGAQNYVKATRRYCAYVWLHLMPEHLKRPARVDKGEDLALYRQLLLVTGKNSVERYLQAYAEHATRNNLQNVRSFLCANLYGWLRAKGYVSFAFGDAFAKHIIDNVRRKRSRAFRVVVRHASGKPARTVSPKKSGSKGAVPRSRPAPKATNLTVPEEARAQYRMLQQALLNELLPSKPITVLSQLRWSELMNQDAQRRGVATKLRTFLKETRGSLPGGEELVFVGPEGEPLFDEVGGAIPVVAWCRIPSVRDELLKALVGVCRECSIEPSELFRLKIGDLTMADGVFQMRISNAVFVVRQGSEPWILLDRYLRVLASGGESLSLTPESPLFFLGSGRQLPFSERGSDDCT